MLYDSVVEFSGKTSTGKWLYTDFKKVRLLKSDLTKNIPTHTKIREEKLIFKKISQHYKQYPTYLPKNLENIHSENLEVTYDGILKAFWKQSWVLNHTLLCTAWIYCLILLCPSSYCYYPIWNSYFCQSLTYELVFKVLMLTYALLFKMLFMHVFM